MFVQVVVNIPAVSGVFDYHVPDELSVRIKAGCLVEVPFNRQTVQGTVLDEIGTPSVAETRPVLALLDPEPVLTYWQLKLVHALSYETLSSLSSLVEAMLPPGLSQQADTMYELAPSPQGLENADLKPVHRRILAALERRGTLRGRQLDKQLPHQDWRPAAQSLLRKGWLVSRPVLPPVGVRPRVIRTARLVVPPSAIPQEASRVGRGEAGPRRLDMLCFLAQETLPVSVSWVYAASGGTLTDLLFLAEHGYVELGEEEIWRDPLEDIHETPGEIPTLTPDQQDAWQEIQQSLDGQQEGRAFPPLVLHGVSSSGKTELYLRAAEKVLAQGRQAIILVPEIAMTPQAVRRFLARFPGMVGLVHSQLSNGERYDTWRRARAGQLPIIVGPRSALFSPLPDPGLVVVDEFHDDSYYQSDQTPYYHAVEAAVHLTRLTGATLLLGSATPPVTWMHRASREKWPVCRLPARVVAHSESVRRYAQERGSSLPGIEDQAGAASLPLPPVQLVDMREELKQGNRSIFSQPLQDNLAQVLELQQQAILFINRRGHATYIFCRECGLVLRCPHCDLPLTLHLQETLHLKGDLICHTCQYRRKLPQACPGCGSTAIRQYGMGTEKVEQEIIQRFPEARVMRWDASSAGKKGAHDLILSHFSRHQADILVGTQMLSKGLDLPLVTLVGVVLADVGLGFPDYRASERTFQLLSQVAGRAGRSPLGGNVIFQTFQPDHHAIRLAAAHDIEGFFSREIENRRSLGFPPFSRLVRVEVRHKRLDGAEQAAAVVAAQLQYWIREGSFRATRIIGPSPCFFAREAGCYRWQVILAGPDPAAILRGRRLESALDAALRIEVNPPDLL